MRNVGGILQGAILLLFVAGSALLAHRVFYSEDLRVGFVARVEAAPRARGSSVLLDNPLEEAWGHVCVSEELCPGEWIVAQGESRDGGGEPCFEAARVWRFPEFTLPEVPQLSRPWILGLGGALLLLGFLTVRIGGAILLAIVLAVVAWHAAAVGVADDALHIERDHVDWVMLPAAFVGAVLGGRKHGFAAYVAHRLSLMVVLLTLAPLLHKTFAWGGELAPALALFVPALSCSLGLGMLCATCLANGASASVLGANVILAAVLCVIYLLVNGPRKPRFLRSASNGGQIRIADLMP